MVESEELIFQTAQQSKQLASVLRGGAFKPLSFPYRSSSYTETREVGLEWMYQAGIQHDIPIITEVMDQRLVETVAEKADILQIGSRNMQNYPLLTEAARTGRAIMLKRHYGASLRDWLGAAEYILHEGNNNVILCERGSAYLIRTVIAHALQLISGSPAAKEATHLPIVTDPSQRHSGALG